MNYDRYFSRGQKVFLIDMSATRDESVYHSMTGSVVSCDDQRITIKCSYRIFTGEQAPFTPGMLFKLTTESFGMGVQLCATLTAIHGQETLCLEPMGIMESYQRRQAVRVDTTLPFLHVPQKSSLSAFRREWKRVITDLHQPNPPRLKLSDTPLNLSVGGLRFETIAFPTELALVVLNLQDEQPPICAITELVWHKTREDSDRFISGHRFIEILKQDQVRLAEFVARHGDRSAASRLKDNWDLQDRMMHPHPDPDKKD